MQKWIETTSEVSHIYDLDDNYKFLIWLIDLLSDFEFQEGLRVSPQSVQIRVWQAAFVLI